MTLPNASLILVMVCFWLTFWLVKRLLVGPLTAAIGERTRRITGAERTWQTKHAEHLSATERLEAEIEDAARQAAHRRETRREEALQARQRRMEAAHAAAEERLRAATDELDGEAGVAREELHRRARELAARFAARLLDREVAS